MNNILDLAQNLSMALKSIQMYQATHPRSQDALNNAQKNLESWLATNGSLQIVVSDGKAFVDGQPVEGNSIHLTALIKQVSDRQVSGFDFHRGVVPSELLEFVQVLLLKPQRIEEMGGVAAILESRGVHTIRVTQTRYKAVRDGEAEGGAGGDSAGAQGGGVDPLAGVMSAAAAGLEAAAAAPASRPPETLVNLIREALLSTLGGMEGFGEGLGGGSGSPDEDFVFVPAHLGELGPMGYRLGLGEGMPTPPQLGVLRQVIMSLPAESQLNLLGGIASLPERPQGLALGVKSLAPELLSYAVSTLLQQGVGWQSLMGPVHEILTPLPDRGTMAGALVGKLRSMHMDAGPAERLMKMFDWDGLNLETKMMKVLHEGQIFEISPENRLALMRELLDQKRFDEFLRMQEMLLESLRHERPDIRGKAAQTLLGVCRWAEDPGLPKEAEADLSEGLRAHFAWEPDPLIHRWSTEAIGAMQIAFLHRGELHHVRADLQELNDLAAFMEEAHPWRIEALDRLREQLAEPRNLQIALDTALLTDKEQLGESIIPYMEFVGPAMPAFLVEKLGNEPDRVSRGRLLELLKAMGPLALPSLETALRASTWYMIRNALTLLADLGNSSHVPSIMPLIRHPEPRVCRAAVRALWKLGGSQSESPLLGRLKDADSETQLEILFAMGQLKALAAAPIIADMLQDKKIPERVRVNMIETLTLIGSPKVLPQLGELLRRKGFFSSTGEPMAIRFAAAKAIYTMGNPASKASLHKILEAEPKGPERETLLRIFQ